MTCTNGALLSCYVTNVVFVLSLLLKSSLHQSLPPIRSKLQGYKREICTVVYIYIQSKDTYVNQLDRCTQVWLRAKLARLDDNENRHTAALFPEVDIAGDGISTNDQSTRIQYFIGARKKQGAVYRWENGPAVQQVYAENQSIISRVSDFGKTNMCLTLTKQGRYASRQCEDRLPAVCQVCAAGLNIEDCTVICVCPHLKEEEDSEPIKCAKSHSCPPGCIRGRLSSNTKKSASTLPCPVDRWGPDCRFQCNCGGRETACNLLTGACPGICVGKWTGSACNETGGCAPHEWGLRCENRCFCRDRQSCDIDTGECLTGCQEGDFGASCSDTDCPPGKFGLFGCERYCHCSGNSSCSKRDGFCLSEKCEENYYGFYCNETLCDTGTWGPDCSLFCACDRHEQCDINTGKCPYACRVGWIGESCNKTACPGSVKFGPDCSKQCDCGGDPCDPYNGKCPDVSFVLKHKNCDQPGYYGKHCDQPCKVAHCVNCDRWTGTTCYQCKEEWEVSLDSKFCVFKCKAGKSGNVCKVSCTDKLCLRCHREDANLCLTCLEGKQLVDNGTCTFGCKKPNFWGDNCDKHCAEPKCFLCDRETGKRCSECIVGWKLDRSKGICVDDPDFNEYVESVESYEYDISKPLLLAVIVELIICFLIYHICRCNERFGVRPQQRLAHPTFNQEH